MIRKILRGRATSAGAALQGTFGVSWQVTPRFWSDLAMVEDLTADSTSDVVLQLMIGTKF